MGILRFIAANEPSAARRRVFFPLGSGVGGPLVGVVGQPQVSVDGGPWAPAGIGPLVEVGGGDYYADLAPASVATPGTSLRTRFVLATPVPSGISPAVPALEFRGDEALVTAFDPCEPFSFGARAIPPAVPGDPRGLPRLADFFAINAGFLAKDAAVGSVVRETAAAVLGGAESLTQYWSLPLSDPAFSAPDTIGHLFATRLDTNVGSRLAPTAEGRTLDVSAGGNAGVDWANVESSTAPQSLSGTTLGGVADKAGFALADAQTFSTSGSVGSVRAGTAVASYAAGMGPGEQVLAAIGARVTAVIAALLGPAAPR